MAILPTHVCRNRNCASFGRAHYNCKCGAPSSEGYAHGGEIEKHHCEGDRLHYPACEFYADGGAVEANHEFDANPTLAVDHSIVSHGLLHALTRTGHSKSDNFNKPSEDFLDHSHRGRKSTKSHMEHHLNPSHEYPTHDKEGTAGLKKYIDSVRQNPMELMDAPGLPGNPGHSAALGAKAAVVSNYFDSIRPTQSMPGPLDDAIPVDKMAEQNYNRQLSLAERPLSILGKVRDGTVSPSDMKTLQTIYPELTRSIQNKAFESVINAKSGGSKIPYKHKLGLSHLLGQPLDATMTQPAMQAIMAANAGAKAESQGVPQPKKGNGATAETQKTIKSVDKLYMDPLQKIQAGK